MELTALTAAGSETPESDELGGSWSGHLAWTVQRENGQDRMIGGCKFICSEKLTWHTELTGRQEKEGWTESSRQKYWADSCISTQSPLSYDRYLSALA